MIKSTRLAKRYSIHFAAVIATALLLLAGGHAMADDCFDGDKAFDHVRAMVEIGPRPSGSAGIAKTRQYLLNELALPGIEVCEQRFVADTPLGPVEMKNIVAVLPGKTEDIIIIGTHYETKLFRNFTFVGANDGGSGTAVLVELARCLSMRENEPTIWLVFFDGEEAFVKSSSTDGLYGSRHMVNELFKTGDLATVKAMILLDMVGDGDLSIEWEGNSTPWLRSIVWENAEKLGYREWLMDKGRRIDDDHVPFLSHGIPSIGIIDLRFGPQSRTNEYWHTPEDTLDKVSPASLKIIGDVVLESIDPIMEHINREATEIPEAE